MDIRDRGAASIRAAAAMLLLLAPAACGVAGAGGEDTVVRDSAGITIVENAGAGAWVEGSAWRVSAEPVVDIGVLEGSPEYQLFEVAGSARLSDGRIVVANAGTHELRFYADDGAYLASAGGEGEGPGEFTRLVWVDVAEGDTVLAYDGRLRRLSVFDSRRAFVRSVQVEPPTGAFSRSPTGRLADGSLVVPASRIIAPDEVEDGVHDGSVWYMRYAMDGALLDTIGRFPGMQNFVRTMGRGFNITRLAFGRAPDVAAHGERFYFGAGTRYEIRVHSPSGALERLVRKAHDRRRVTAEDVERYEREQLEDTDNETWRRRLRGMLDDMPIPQAMPAYAGLEVDAAGNLWVARYRAPGDEPPRWDVFDRDGRLLGVVETPSDFEVHEIGRDYVLGLRTDAFDVEHIQVFELIKPEPAG